MLKTGEPGAAMPRGLREVLDPYALRVVCYHSVAEDHPFLPRHLYVTPACLHRHLDAIRRVFHCITFRDLGRVQRREVRFPLVVTFDDGLRDGVDAALPVLRECGVPATFFVSALPIEAPDQILWTHGLYHLHRRVGLRRLADELTEGRYQARTLQELVRWLRVRGEPLRVRDDIRAILSYPEAGAGPGPIYLTRADLRTLVDSGMEIGAHAYSHFDVSRLEELKRESLDAKRAVQAAAGVAVRAFAYPFGDPESCSDRTHAHLRHEFDVLCTTVPGINGPTEQEQGLLHRVCAYEMPEGKVLLKLLLGV